MPLKKARLFNYKNSIDYILSIIIFTSLCSAESYFQDLFQRQYLVEGDEELVISIQNINDSYLKNIENSLEKLINYNEIQGYKIDNNILRIKFKTATPKRVYLFEEGIFVREEVSSYIIEFKSPPVIEKERVLDEEIKKLEEEKSLKEKRNVYGIQSFENQIETKKRDKQKILSDYKNELKSEHNYAIDDIQRVLKQGELPSMSPFKKIFSLLKELFIVDNRNTIIGRIYLKEAGITGFAVSDSEIKTEKDFYNVFNGVVLNISKEEAEKIKKSDYVKDVYPNEKVYANLMDSVHLIGADDVWQLDEDGNNCTITGKPCLNGENVTIAIIDTGIDYTHPDLGGEQNITPEDIFLKVPIEPVGGTLSTSMISFHKNFLAYERPPSIYYFDFLEQNESQLSLPSEFTHSMFPTIWDSKLVFDAFTVDWDPEALVVRDLITNTEDEIIRFNRFTTDPRIAMCSIQSVGSKYVTFPLWNDNQCNILFTYNLDTGEKREILLDKFIIFAKTYEDYIAYTTNIERKLYYYDVSTSTNHYLDVGNVYVQEVTDFKDDIIVFRYRDLSYNDNIGYYNLNTGSYKLYGQPGIQSMGQYDDGFIFYFSDVSVGKGKIVAININTEEKYYFGSKIASRLEVENSRVIINSNNILYYHDFDSSRDYPETEVSFPTNKVIGGYDFVNNDDDPMDDNGHGTHCAGITAGDGNFTFVEEPDEPPQNLFSFSVDNMNDVAEVNAEIKEGPAQIDLLYGNGTDFTGVGGDNYNRLVTSYSNTLLFDRDTDSYFVASWSDSTNGESYLLKVISITGDNSENYTTIENLVTGIEICSNRKKGDICIHGNVVLTIGTINRNEETVELTINLGGSFNKFYDKNEFYINLPVLSDLPIDIYTFEIFNKLGQVVESHEFYWSYSQLQYDPPSGGGGGGGEATSPSNEAGLKGVAPKSKLYAYKVLDSSGSGWSDDIIAGIERAVDPNDDGDFSDHVDVISMSLGGGGDPDDPMSLAIDNAVDAGVIAVIAAGNSGPWENSIGSPGTSRKAITIGASDKYDNIASFSSRGPVVWYDENGTQQMLIKPDVVAPGVEICSAQYDSAWNDKKCLDDKHVAISGTSMATPHVAGLAALLKQKNPTWTAEEVKMAIRNTAIDIGEDITTQGHGRIDVKSAIQLNSNPTIAKIETFGLLEQTIDIKGTAKGSNFYYYEVFYSEKGSNIWDLICNGTGIIDDGILCSNFNPLEIPDGEYYLRLDVYGLSGEKSEDYGMFSIDLMDILNPPFNNEIYRLGEQVKIDVINKRSFTSCSVQFKKSNESTWLDNGIIILDQNNLSAIWNTSGLEKGFYDINVSFDFEFGTSSELIELIYLDPDLKPGWPVKIDYFYDSNHYVPWGMEKTSKFLISSQENNYFKMGGLLLGRLF